MGLESDPRAGGVRVSASDIVSKPGDLTKNVDRMAQMFRQGKIDANDIRERFGARGIAEDRAAIAKAGLATKQVEELGDLQIAAQKEQLDPALIGLQKQAQVGSLEEQIATNANKKVTRKMRDKADVALAAQALNDITGGLPSEAARQMSLMYPNVVKPQFDKNGVVLNQDEVKAQIGHVKTQKQWIDAMRDLADSTERQVVDLENGGKLHRVVIKGTNIALPRHQQEAIWAAQQMTPGGVIKDPDVAQAFQQTFGQPGQVSVTPGVPPAQPQAQAPSPLAPGSVLPPPGEPVQVTGPQLTPEGDLIVGSGKGGSTQRQKLTDIQSFVQKSQPIKTYQLMAPFAAQAATITPKLRPGTGQYMSEFDERTGKALDHSLIFNYMKLVDPTSVVREGEFKYATGLSPFDDFLINKSNIKNKWLNRQIMTDSTRLAMLNRIKDLTYATAESAVNGLLPFVSQAERAGLSAEQAIGAENADLLRAFKKMPGKPTVVNPFLQEAIDFVEGQENRSKTIPKVDAQGRADPKQIIRISPDDETAIQRAKRTGESFWIKGEPRPRQFR
jgi:hypothetical protein